jgi:F420-non-reducing hydrogenase small subunit
MSPTARPAAKPDAKPARSAKAGAKPKLAIFGAASCGGCDIAIVNIHEKILDVAAAFDIVLWPTIMDGKYGDLEALADGEIAVTLVSGSMRTDETIHLARLLRRKSQLLVAFGSCAGEGCIPGLANLSSAQEILDTVYSTATTDNPRDLRPVWEYEVPEGILYLPRFEPFVQTLDQVVDVDYAIPGCPPESSQIAAVIDVLIAALNGTGPLPPKGSILGAGHRTVCDECARTRDVKSIDKFVRITDQASFDPEICLLEQGLPCNGSATRSGCGALCPAAASPCIGCYGAADGVVDFGARLMSAFASVVTADKPEEIDRALAGIVDPVGQFYRFSLASSLLRSAKAAWKTDGEQ